MNFFGHAAVASWSSAPPAAVLGAMLPDFATMIGSRLAEAADAEVARGVDLHHATDAAFHTLPAVTGLMRELDAQLAGCARGPRRAVAHIGVELLLDGVLAREPAYRAAYLAGIAYEPDVQWRDDDGARRFPALLARLRARGVPDDLASPEAVTTRLGHILAPRPRLAATADDLRIIRGALIAFQPRLEVAAETVMRALSAKLA